MIIIKNFKILLILFILIENNALFAMQSLFQEGEAKEEIEEIEKIIGKTENKQKNYTTSNCYYHKKPIITESYLLEFVTNDKIKISELLESEKQKGDVFIELQEQKNAISFVIANQKKDSPYILVFTQKFNFNAKDKLLKKERFCEIMQNPENILIIYNIKTGKQVKVLSEVFPELKMKKIFDIKFLKNSNIIGLEHIKTYDIETCEIESIPQSISQSITE